MKNVYIFGRGQGFAYVNRCLQNSVNIVAIIDNFTNDSFQDGIKIIRQKEIIANNCDYIIISLMKYHEIKNELSKIGINPNRLICFFDWKDAENEEFYEVLDLNKWKTELLWKYHKEVIAPRMENMFYETNAEYLKQTLQIPNVVDYKKTIDLIIGGHKSLVRFGDGEFEMMLGRLRLRYQGVNEQLAIRLKRIIKSNNENVLVAIANNYGNLSDYTDEAADGIRSYLTPTVRQEHMSLLDLKRDYYDAYVSRPYIMYRDKSEIIMKEKFTHIKKIWENQDLLIVEGKHTRFGVGNDMLSMAASVKRLLVPDKEAFSIYDDILKKAMEYGKNRLILSIIGPTATVLSYDLALSGYWAIDIGQVDTEYEWFLQGTNERSDIPFKTVSEYADKGIFSDIPENIKKVYENEIIDVLEM